MIELIPVCAYFLVVVATFLMAKKDPDCWVVFSLANICWIVYSTLQFPIAYGVLLYGLGMNVVNLYGAWEWLRSSREEE